MSLLESIRIPLGTQMPDFSLKNASGKEYQGRELYGEKGLLLAFICNHCPYAQAIWPRFIRLAKAFKDQGINSAAVNPNIHPDYPDDAPEKMIETAQKLGIDFPYLVDETQKVAKAFKAQCTPDIYLFDQNRELVYHGRVDDNWKDESGVTKEELKEALDNLAAGRAINKEQKPSMGCSIKWQT